MNIEALEYLSNREIEILHLIAEGFSDREIAQKLYLSVNTVKWHNRQIYAKLRVSSRTQAVASASERGLLAEIPYPEPSTSLIKKHNLPSNLIPFVGRNRELEALTRMVTDPDVRLVTILGAGGMGKSRLAMAFAEEQLTATVNQNGRREPRYKDGVFVVHLAPLESIDSIVPTAAEALGFRLSEKRNPQQQLIDYLSDKNLLLIFDNFEHLLEGAGLVTEILVSAPQVQVMATSRMRLNIGGEHRYQITGLDLPEEKIISMSQVDEFSSLELFRQCACCAKADFVINDENANTIAEICRLLGGMPLGIRLAATWVNLLSPAEIKAEILGGLDLLETQEGDIPQRHSSIRSVFDHSWELLTEKEQVILGGLTVFRGGMTREAAQKVTGASLKDLKSLANNSLITPVQGGRYEVHELLRQYGAEKLTAMNSVKEKILDKYCEYYLGFLAKNGEELKGSRQLEALRAIEEDINNALAAWNHAIEREQVERLDQAVDGICRYLNWRRRIPEGYQVCEGVIREYAGEASQDDSPVIRLVIKAQTWFSYFCSRKDAAGALDQAHFLVVRCEEQNIACERERAHLYFQLGESLQTEDRVRAKENFEISLASYRKTEDLWGQAKALTAIGWLAAHEGDTAGVKKYSQESQHLRQIIGDKRGLADSLWLLGADLVFQDAEEAKSLINQSIEIRQEMGDSIIDVSSGPVDLGMTLTWIGRTAEADQVREETLAASIERGLIEKIAEAQLHLSMSKGHIGDFDAMKEHAERGYELYQQLNDRRGMARAKWRASYSSQIDSNCEEAIPIFEECIGTLRECGDDGEVGWIIAYLAEVRRAKGENDQAKILLAEGLKLGAGIFTKITALAGLPMYVLMLADRGEKERAVEIIGLLNQNLLFRNSRVLLDLYGKNLDQIYSQLPDDVASEAFARGKSLDLEETVRIVLDELETESIP